MEVSEMKITDVEERLNQIETELATEDADVEKLSAEVDELQERKVTLKAEAEEQRALMTKVAEMKQPTVIEERQEAKAVETIEIRNTNEYINAFANYIKNGDDTECRALITENESGTVAVPEFVYDVVRTAWEREGIMSLVRKTYMKGNLKVGFEISGSDAIVHTEGGAAIDPENLVLGTVNMVPASIKKAVQISD